MSVLVLDAAHAGGGTTSKGMGHLVTLDGSEAQLALTSYSVALWRELSAALPLSVEYDMCGTIWLAEDADEMDALRDRNAANCDQGIASELLSRAALVEKESHLRKDLAGGLLVPGDGVLLPPFATRWLLDQASIEGAELREDCLVDQIDDGTVRCGDESFEAEVILNAAGVHAPTLTPALRIVPRKGHLAITNPCPGTIRHQLVELGYLRSAHQTSGASVAFNVQPRANGQIIIGASRELVGFDAEMNAQLLQDMLDRAAHFLPKLSELSIERTWTGFRPASEDGLPMIGRWAPDKPLWIAAGHEGLGITTALGTAVLLADLVAGRAPSIDPAPYAPARVAEMPGQNTSMESAHEKG